MRKSGWAAATGLGSLVLLLAACGGSSSSSTSAAGPGSGSAPAAGSSAPASSASAVATATKKASGNSTSKPKVHNSAGPQPSSGGVSFPPVGTTVMVVQKSAIGYVLAEANGQVVYTYSKDSKGGVPTCTGSCATTWLPVTGVPKAGPADTFPGQFGVVKRAGGGEQITYEGMPLYALAGAKPLTTKGNGLNGEWHVIPLSVSDISGA